jgi:anti-anti-sigma factor
MDDAIGDVHVEHPTASAAIVRFTGEHDLVTRDEVAALLESLIEQNDFVVADFSEATFVDSTILHVLVNADAQAHTRGRTFRLQIGSAAIVHRAFDLSGLTKRLDCCQSREEALEGAGAPPSPG